MGMKRQGWTGKHGEMDFMAVSCIIDEGVKSNRLRAIECGTILTPDLNHGYFYGENRKTILKKKKQK